ncbi:hypothetical protein [Peribacillus frigoritolerans]|uniref:hypothetical protein n=1 Tax=Peribacillus frigoritolerans TaxID=450367 RepID=UPI00207A6CBA|nr:hypothetical protein [Peribacillus frigoritolerans]USK64047.1 hypothetical protein LIT26_23080 [Peribacillus frigoritolerans]
MFAAFDLNIDDINNSFKEHGNKLFLENKRKVEVELNEFLDKYGSVDGTSIQNNWFPQIEADVFISHSHNDHEKAIILAGWLNQVFKLNVFLDSCVWGSADALLKKIDDSYCWMSDLDSYSYEKRNYSTSHVHTMLSVALNSMIDKSECLIFLNTPNSINTKDVIQLKTTSPWIYLEIAMSKIVRKKIPDRKILKKAHFESVANELTINYRLDTRHLHPLSIQDLNRWKKVYSQARDIIHPLDVLYKQHNLTEDLSIVIG